MARPLWADGGGTGRFPCRRSAVSGLHLRCLVGAILACAAMVAACAPVSVLLPVQGRVVDGDTRDGIGGATVEVVRTRDCFTPVQGVQSYAPPWEAVPAADGGFSVGGGAVVPPCTVGSWVEERLRNLAPGYVLAIVSERERKFGEPIGLDRIRYALELEERRQSHDTEAH